MPSIGRLLPPPLDSVQRPLRALNRPTKHQLEHRVPITTILGRAQTIIAIGQLVAAPKALRRRGRRDVTVMVEVSRVAIGVAARERAVVVADGLVHAVSEKVSIISSDLFLGIEVPWRAVSVGQNV